LEFIQHQPVAHKRPRKHSRSQLTFRSNENYVKYTKTIKWPLIRSNEPFQFDS